MVMIIYFPPFRKERERMGHPAVVFYDSRSVEGVIGRKNKVGKRCPGKLKIAH
jgi:hypothetical protein